jgi:hypothetical protein
MRTLIDYITKEEFELSFPRRFHGRGYKYWIKYKDQQIYRASTYDSERFQARYIQLRRRPKIFLLKNGNDIKFVKVLKRHINRFDRVVIRFEIIDNLAMAEYIDDNRDWLDQERKKHELTLQTQDIKTR